MRNVACAIFSWSSQKRAAFGVVVLLMVFFSGCGPSRPPDLIIIHTNDLKGYVMPGRVPGWRRRMGGYAAFSSWLNEVRRDNELHGVPTILLDAGNIFSGTAEGCFRKGEAVVELMNLVDYDAMGLSVGEFEFGYFNLLHLAEKAKFPFLCANVMRGWGAIKTPDFAQSYLVKEIDGLKIGLFGVVSDEMELPTPSGDVDRLVFRDPVLAARECTRVLRAQGCRMVVALSHLGLENNLSLGRKIRGLDVIIGGGGESLLTSPARVGGGGALVCQLDGLGRHAGRLDLWLDKRTGVVHSHRYRIFTNREWEYPLDLKVSSRLAEIRGEMGRDWDRVIGVALQDMALAGGRESALGNLVADSLCTAAQTEVAFQDIAGIKSPIFKGSITVRDIFRVLPDDRMIVVMELEGRRIKELLEEVFSSDQPFLQVSGLLVRYDPARPPGRRVLSLRIGGVAANDDRFYTVAIPDVLAEDENRCRTFREGKNWRLTGLVVRDALVEYINGRPPLFSGSSRPDRLIRAKAGRYSDVF